MMQLTILRRRLLIFQIQHRSRTLWKTWFARWSIFISRLKILRSRGTRIFMVIIKTIIRQDGDRTEGQMAGTTVSSKGLLEIMESGRVWRTFVMNSRLQVLVQLTPCLRLCI